jgi:hypothetical protein
MTGIWTFSSIAGTAETFMGTDRFVTDGTSGAAAVCMRGLESRISFSLRFVTYVTPTVGSGEIR